MLESLTDTTWLSPVTEMSKAVHIKMHAHPLRSSLEFVFSNRTVPNQNTTSGLWVGISKNTLVHFDFGCLHFLWVLNFSFTVSGKTWSNVLANTKRGKCAIHTFNFLSQPYRQMCWYRTELLPISSDDCLWHWLGDKHSRPEGHSA